MLTNDNVNMLVLRRNNNINNVHHLVCYMYICYSKTNEIHQLKVMNVIRFAVISQITI